MIVVKKREGESSESLLRRFSRKVQSSRLIIRVKKNQYHTRDKSKNLQREQALRRNRIRTKNDYLRKIGKLDDEPMTGGRRPIRPKR